MERKINVKVNDLSEKLQLDRATGSKGQDRIIECGYCGDLLSEVMGNAPEKSIWLTVQSHCCLARDGGYYSDGRHNSGA